ncbi:intein C-terminal splicing region/intein N-terminal splicing region [Asanoa hainanensis]|uniref:Intein C-terminal splicing region/intein N-terminal splicing region n=2 Tax=Asanoa hainanensis TaxID=560556 RepID=A0A239NRT1_9ACTN|nr:intein C-terminal splicing region/intein N-terminal splicing region [Asanoa hainanensis]
MIHGVWTGGRLGLWGEQPPEVPGALATLTLTLPTVDGKPVPASEEPPPDATLAAWPVEAVLLDPGPALDLLLDIDDLDWTPGGDLRYLAVVASYAAGLLRRGRLLPALVTADGAHAARWRPVLTGRDAAAFRELAAAMPGAVRAADAAPPGQVLRDLLDAFTDAAARRSLPERLLLGHRPGPKAPVADRWMRALTADDPTVTATTAQRPELAALRTALDGWHRSAHQANEPVRVCFRLVEPLPTTDRWDLEFALQSVDDPSLYVPADVIWAGQRVPGLPARPDETLLAGLGRAVRLFPPLDEALREAQPTESILDTAAAFTFLRQAAPLLQAAGYGVQLPAWAGRKTLGLKLTTRTKSTAGGGKALAAQGVGKDQLVDFKVDLMVGDEEISAADLHDLARLKVPLLRVKGRWVELDDRQLTAAIRAVEQHRTGELTIAEVLGQVAAGGEEDLPLVAVDADGWLGDLLSGDADHRLQPTATPPTFQGTLRPYQERGLSWLDFLSRLGIGGILADDMGLGKCIGPESPVFLNGTLVSAEDAWQRYGDGTSTFDDGEGQWRTPTEPLVTNALDAQGRMVVSPVTRLYRQRIAEKVRLVELDDGSQLTVTRRHRLRGVEEWTRDFSVGDTLCVPGRLEWSGAPVAHDLVRLLAWQISEGDESRNGTLRITQKDPAILHALVRHIHAVGDRFQLTMNSPRVFPDRNCHVLRMCSAGYAAFLRQHGYEWGRRSAHKRIPDLVMAADEASVRLFLREFFSAEGSVNQRMRMVEISSASRWLMDQLVTLLRRFGVWMRVTTKNKTAVNGSGIARPYRVGVIGGGSLRRFNALVGFSDPIKQGKLDGICATKVNTNVEGIPGSDLLRAAHALTKLPQRHFGVGTVYFAGSQELSRPTATAAVEAIDRILSGEAERAYQALPTSKWTTRTRAAYAALDRPALADLRERLEGRTNQQVYYSRVTSIQDVDYTGEVYDFEVAGEHNFVAGGMLCHNTAQTLSLLLAERERGAVGSTLLVCPMSLVSNWRKEAEKFAPSLDVYVHHGATRDAARLGKADLVITTYGTALRDLEALRAVEWGRVVCDEAQAIKNSGTRQSQAVRAIPARTRLALTGTPVENHLAELWSIMDFANPGLLGPAKTFRRRYQEPIEVRQDEDAAAALKRATGPFVLRRLKTDKTIISDLPEKLEMKVWCPLTPEQAALYQAVVDDMLNKIGSSMGIERRGNVLAAMTRLKQVCNHPAHLLRDGSKLAGRSGKLARLQELAEEIVEEGDKGLVFTQYAEFGSLLQPYLAAHLDRPVLWLHGGLSKQRRDELVTRFQNDPEPMIFLLSLKAAGTGLNLTAANHVIHVDRWWNPAVEDQATDRAYRIGQARNVQVRKFVCTGTIEERVDEMIERKKALAQRVVGTGEEWLTELSTEELRDLFALDPKAVG